MLKNLKIGTKLFGSFIIYAALLLAVGTISFISMKQMNNADSMLYEKATVPMGDFVTISSSFHQARILLLDIARSEDRSIIQSKVSVLNDLVIAIGKSADNVEKTIVTEEGKKTLQEFIDARKQFKLLVDQVVTLAQERKNIAAYAIIDGPAALAAHKEQASIDRLVELKVGVAKGIANRNRALTQQSETLIIVFSVLGLVLVLVLGLFLVKSITVPLANMTKVAKKIAEGNINEQIEYAANDEIGLLADSFRNMISALQGVVHETQLVVKEAGQGVFNKKADTAKFNGAYRDLLSNINELMDSISKPVQNVLHSLACLANNDTSEKISIQYSGVWGELKTSVNTTIERIEHIIAIVNKVSVGNIDELDGLKKVGKRSQNDQLMPAFVRMMEAIKGIIRATEHFVQEATVGNLSVRGNPNDFDGGYRDIITGLNQTLEAVQNPINECEAVLAKIAGRDMVARVNGDYKGDYAKIKNSVNTTADNLDTALQQVSQATEQVSSASQQISAGSQSLAQGANEQASSLEEVSSSLEEMSSMTKQNAENANQAKTLAGEANNNAAEGKHAMALMSESIKKIKESSDETAKIVKTIDEIAMQTNLLALNAAVEAARAGEAGRGFAVVAEEVRNLAQRSAQAAKNTANMIAESVKNSEEGVNIAANVAKSFEAIAVSNSKVDSLIAEIAAASQEQSQGIDQVNTAVSQMDKVTQQNAANSEESASAAEELSSQAEELQSMVAQFALSNKSNGSSQLETKPQAIQPVTASRSDMQEHRKNGGNGRKHAAALTIGQANKPGNGKIVNPESIIPMAEEVLKEF